MFQINVLAITFGCYLVMTAAQHGGRYHDFITRVLDVNLKAGGQYDPNAYWNVNCNIPKSHRSSYLIGIHDDKNWFTDLDYVKCIEGTDSYSKVFRLDKHKNVIISLSPKDPHHQSECPRGGGKYDDDYVLTALYDKSKGFPHVVCGKCTALKYTKLNKYECIQIPTSKGKIYSHGGSYEPNTPWEIECPHNFAMTGLLRDYERIQSITCCPEDDYHKTVGSHH
ncbi:unnamed protein product [Cyprideis torosa]|uniref:Uncharacterized protein n=1 Tax=Cyprideis torosa TaxID=163714 RepID=A0A7R8WF29_9CRUS|nr:unnamed protein product [Cyprideis torosa]CAG0890163.1 unnamed protein product [Cyprideis torosa]